jgi:hypothetical protein
MARKTSGAFARGRACKQRMKWIRIGNCERLLAGVEADDIRPSLVVPERLVE